ncbi:MAG TPA: DUF3344 domain-containing protein [Methanolinea sp.]|nr:DUF3344 domain-containing protein [Methanolinea sp.]
MDEDLAVTAISPNLAFATSGNYMFANEPNTISVTVTNNGGLDAAASTVSIVVGSNTYTAAVGTLAAGASETVTVTDSVTRTAGTVTVTATADSGDIITESNEANNVMTSDLTIYNCGYKGKRWTGGDDMTTKATFDGRYDLIYSTGDSIYKSAKWLSATDTWTSTDLPVPAGATVVSARLYQPYNFNKMASDPAFTASFNGNTISTIASYKDVKGFGSSNYPYGLYVYDVTSQFNTAGNTLVLTPEGTPGTTNDYALYGAYLVVTYSDPTTTEKQIWINDEYDMITSATNAPTYKYPVSDAEATVYAPFTGIDTSDVASAQAIAILASASDSGRSKFFFNSNEYTGFWADYLTSPNIGFSVYDVTGALASGSNEARLQSYDAGTGGDGMYAMNTILIVEKTEGAVIASFTPATQVTGDRPFTVNFDSGTSTGYITGYAWDFGDTGTSTEANPGHEYTARGTYDVSLTVTGVGSSDTETKTALVVVKEPAPVIDFTATPTSGVEPLAVAFDATNTGGAVNSWKWEYKLNSAGTWTEFATIEDASFTFTDGVYDVRLTAEGADYTDIETKENLISVGSSSIDVTVEAPASIDFGTMQAGVDETGSKVVNVDVTGGTPWSVTATATNGGYMISGATPLTNPFQLSNDGSTFQAMTTNFVNFMNGSAGVDGSDTADVKQAIVSADAPGSYSITLTFTGGFA